MGRFVPQSVTINSWLPDRFQYRIEGNAGRFLLAANMVALLAVFYYASQFGGGEQIAGISTGLQGPGPGTTFVVLAVLLLVGDINLSYAYESKATALVLAIAGIVVAGVGFMIPMLRLPLPFGFEATFSVIQALALYPLTVVTAAAVGFKLQVWHGATDRLLEMGQEKMEEARETESKET